MKRKLSFGIALIGHPPVLLLDEPTAGIDPSSSSTITEELSNYKKNGGMVLLTSHNMLECEKLCDR